MALNELSSWSSLVWKLCHGENIYLWYSRFPEIWTFFMWTQRNWEFRHHRNWSLKFEDRNLGSSCFPQFVQNFSERQILWSLCSVDFHTFTLQLPIQTLHSVVSELQILVSSLENSQNFSKTRANNKWHCSSNEVYYSSTNPLEEEVYSMHSHFCEPICPCPLQWLCNFSHYYYLYALTI